MTDPGSTTYRRTTAWMLVASLAFTFLALGILRLLGDHVRAPSGNWKSAGDIALWNLIMLTASVIGVLVARKQPHNRIGWIFASGGFAGTLAAVGDQWSAYALELHPGTLGGALGSHLSYTGLYVSWALLGVLVPLLFPNGEPPSRRWRFVGWLGIVCAVFWSTDILRADLFEPGHREIPGARNPIGIPGAEPVLDLLNVVGLFGLFLAMFVAVVSLIVRYVRSRGEQRQQLKVVAFTAVTATFGLLIAANLMTPLAGTVLSPALDAISLILILAIPASLGVSILRYRLYDFDLVIRKTLVYGVMAAFITAVYVAIVAGVGALLNQQREQNMALSIAATAVAAVAFQPVRERVQRVANRLVFGERATPYEVMAGFSERVGDVLSVDEVLPRMAEAAARGVGAVAARAEVLLHNGETRQAAWPADADIDGAAHTIEVHHRGAQVGRLSVVKAANDPLRPAEQTLIHDLAAQAGVALSNVQLAAELQDSFEQISRQAEQLRESRTRIVEAQDAERRRIERDLHDGAQQRLVALSLTLRLIMNRTAADAELTAMIQGAADELKAAHQELRDLARGIHPAVLTDSGLEAAIRSLIDRAPVPVTVDVPTTRFPPAIEAAAYFVVSEGLTNVAKYARATTASVTVAHADSHLRIQVRDDGRGGADVTQGTGLRGLLDRVAALDGTLQLDSPPGSGTTLTVELPCG